MPTHDHVLILHLLVIILNTEEDEKEKEREPREIDLVSTHKFIFSPLKFSVIRPTSSPTPPPLTNNVSYLKQ